jgi:methanethiol S-methyltransferase
MQRSLTMLFALVAYAIFFVTFLYLIAFVGNIAVVPRTVDVGPAAAPTAAVVIDIALIALFGLQHSVMARPGFKRWWTRIVPPSVERSTYVLAATAALALLLWQWRPILDPVVWTVRDPVAVKALQAVFWLGWGILLLATFLINHFELFGLRQVFSRLVGRAIPEAEFRTPLLYRYVRHPIYLGFLLAFWATPTMTAGHLLFAVATSGYILIGIWLEERDLVDLFGDQYRRYREQVSMLIPLPGRKAKPEPEIKHPRPAE